jgi:hypothetical protein
MSDHSQAQVLQAAAIVALDDAALAARIAYLRSVTDDPELGDDNLTGAGWVELAALEAEQARRRPSMATYTCHECCEVFDAPILPRRKVPCPVCGPGTKVSMVDGDPREKGDDDGVEYGHPGDHLRGRE